MANIIKETFLSELKKRFGSSKKLGNSHSLFEVGDGAVRIYIRYSKIHGTGRGFYGLRKQDLQELKGVPSIICFLWNDQDTPLIIPYSQYEDVFDSSSPSSDGQYKAQIILKGDETELYLANSGRFNVGENFGWGILENILDSTKLEHIPEFSHSQIQSILGAIGVTKGYDIWVPMNDRNNLDWSLVKPFHCRKNFPEKFSQIAHIAQEIDVIWFKNGSSNITALFEVEHSTPIYSGLLRFNDFHLINNSESPDFRIVANQTRRSIYSRQLNRPTFQTSGLHQLCSFLNYANVYNWYSRLI